MPGYPAWYNVVYTTDPSDVYVYKLQEDIESADLIFDESDSKISIKRNKNKPDLPVNIVLNLLTLSRINWCELNRINWIISVNMICMPMWFYPFHLCLTKDINKTTFLFHFQSIHMIKLNGIEPFYLYSKPWFACQHYFSWSICMTLFFSIFSFFFILKAYLVVLVWHPLFASGVLLFCDNWLKSLLRSLYN